VLAVGLGREVVVVDGFREASFGQWDARTLAEVKALWRPELDAWLASPDVAPPGGESLSDVRVRVERALDETLAEYAGRTVAVVSHVNPIKLAVRYCLDVPLEVVDRLLVAPASLTTLSFFASGATALRSFSALP
jgi:ribonuclease H / adenosylcobalamin/alpha-ribazole phosphatase